MRQWFKEATRYGNGTSSELDEVMLGLMRQVSRRFLDETLAGHLRKMKRARTLRSASGLIRWHLEHEIKREAATRPPEVAEAVEVVEEVEAVEAVAEEPCAEAAEVVGEAKEVAEAGSESSDEGEEEEREFDEERARVRQYLTWLPAWIERSPEARGEAFAEAYPTYVAAGVRTLLKAVEIEWSIEGMEPYQFGHHRPPPTSDEVLRRSAAV